MEGVDRAFVLPGLFLKVALMDQFPAYLASYCVMSALIVTTIWIDFKHRLIPVDHARPSFSALSLLWCTCPKRGGQAIFAVSSFGRYCITGDWAVFRQFCVCRLKSPAKESARLGRPELWPPPSFSGLRRRFYLVHGLPLPGWSTGSSSPKRITANWVKPHSAGAVSCLAALVYMFAGSQF